MADKQRGEQRNDEQPKSAENAASSDEDNKAAKAVDKDPEGVAEDGNAQVEEVVEAELEQGFRGTETDMTPNENYTVQGVTSGAPVPEASSDPHLARQAAASDLAARREAFEGSDEK